jgi:hypothetical protein
VSELLTKWDYMGRECEFHMFLKIMLFLYIGISFEVEKLTSSGFSERFQKGDSVGLL